MKKLFLLVFIFTTVLYAQTAIVPIDKAKGIVDMSATSFEEDVYLTDAIPFSNVENDLIGNNLFDPSEKNSPSNFIVKRGERPPIDVQAAPDDAYEKGILKIKLDESFTNQLDNNPVIVDEQGYVRFNITAIDLLNQQYSVASFKKLFECDAFTSEFTERHRAWGFHLWYTLYFDENTDIKELVTAYEQLAEVSIAEPEYKKVLSASETDGSGSPPVDWTPDDPSYNLQWHYHNTGQYSGTVDADIDLPEAWDIEKGNSNVIVAVLDMGIQYDHPDLSGNMWSGIGYDFVNGNTSIEPGYHGTHVAGTVAAETNNGIGVSGVAGGSGSNNGVRLMSCQVFTPSGSGGGFELAPIYAADNGASISQNSWCYTNPGVYEQPVLDAIDYFNIYGGGTALSAGISIFAAGNDNSSSNYYPGYYSGTFAVAATNNQDIRSYYSNYGTWVDISAPGGERHVIDERSVYSTYTTNTYGYLQGTSMACPHVSGTAGLIVSMAYGQLTPGDVADILRNTTDDIDALNPGYVGQLGTGRLNAYQALLETQNYLVTPGTLMPIPPQTSTFTGNTRGYWFTAPTDFTVTGLRVPIDIPGDQTIEIIRFNSGPPPVYSGTTNDFVSLGRWVGVAGTGFITCNIPVANGDYIGILGCRGTTTSYGSNNYSTSIGGNAVTLVRMGMQHPLPTYLAQDIWQEPLSTTLGRVEMYYEITPGIWTGVVNNQWNNAGNWSDGVVPNAGTNVTIPAGTPYDCWVATDDQFCNNITIESGALLRIYDEILTVSWNMYIHGLLKMEQHYSTGVPGELHIGNDIVWESGSTAQILSNSLNMFITGDWNFKSGANVQLTQGYVTFEGGDNSWIRSYDPDCYFNHIRNYKTGIYGLAVSEVSTEDLYINGNIYNYSGNLFRFRSDHSVFLNGFFNNMDGHFEGQSGTLVFDGSAGIALKPNTGDYLNNVTISTTSTLSLDNTYSSLLTVNGNMLIETGGLNAQDFTIEVGGNWTNTGGSLTPGTSLVVFESSGSAQDVTGNCTFYDVQQVNTGQNLRFNTSSGATTILNNLELLFHSWAYRDFNVNGILNINDLGSEFTANGSLANVTIASLGQGGILRCNGTANLTVNDLVENRIIGTYYVNDPGGVLNLTNSGTGTYVDLNADLHIFGGTMNITGDVSWWPFNGNASIEMDSGVLDVTSCGIYLSGSNTLTETITGGTIRTAYGFTGVRTDFNPTGGIIELYGSIDASLSMGAGSNFYNVQINKSASDNIERKSKNKIRTMQDRDGSVIELTRSNTVNAASALDINGNLLIENGTFNLNGNTVDVANDVDVYGTLNMTNAADILNVGDAAYDNLAFRNGSFGNLTAGTVNLASWLWVDVGGLLTATTGNTMNFNGPSVAGIEVDAAGSVFGNINIISVNPFRLYSVSSQLIEVDGNFDLQAGNTIDFQNRSMTIHGLFTDDPTSTVYVYDGPVDGGNTNLFSANGNRENQNDISITKSSENSKDSRSRGGYFEIDTDFTVNGLLDINDGSVLVHGIFGIASTGSVLIDGGSLVADSPHHSDGWEYLYGNLSMTSGLFEITYNSIHFASTATTSISGGTLRTGGAFYGVYTGTFQPTGGIVEIIGDAGDNAVYCSNGNYFYDLVINRTTGVYAALMHETHVQNDLTISSGILHCYNDLYVGGNWTNNIGTGGFVPSTNTVIFDGNGTTQYIYGETTYYNVQQDYVAPGSYLQIIGPTTVLNDMLLNYFTWINNTFDLQGTLNINNTSSKFAANSSGNGTIGTLDQGGTLFCNGGTITVNDLVEDGIYGKYYVNDLGGTLNLTNSGWVDLNGELHISGGTMNVSGTESVWPYAHDAVIEMSDGVLDFTDCQIYIYNSASYSLNDNITGGTIRTAYGFLGDRPDFNPIGGTIELYGSTDASLSMGTGSNFYNVTTNKAATDNSARESGNEIRTIRNRDGSVVELTRSNTVNAASDLDISGDFVINTGALNSGNHIISVSGNVIVNSGGTLYMLANSTLELDTGSALNVYSGGELQVIGTVGNLATVTHRSTDKYAFNVYSGGTISAEYGLFEHMTANGVYVRDGGFVDPSHSFDYCTFQNGYVGSGTLLYVENDDDVIITGANFPHASSTYYNVAKILDQGTITMLDATGSFAGSSYEYDPNDLIHWGVLPAIDDLTIQYNAGTNEIELNWTYPIPVDQYKIYRSTDPYDFSGADVFISYTESYSETVTGTKYFYQVTAENISDNGSTRRKTGGLGSEVWNK